MAREKRSIQVGKIYGDYEVIRDLGCINKSHIYRCRCVKCGSIVDKRRTRLLNGIGILCPLKESGADENNTSSSKFTEQLRRF
ncbi:MAG: hypothetical protein PUF72_05515 [Clostridiales bacterium]|nr:hypothetical protein [Clostridiales bacterium]